MAYRIPVLENFSWQQPITQVINTPTGSETKGTRYIVSTTPSGTFTDKGNQIAWHNGTDWQFDIPKLGWQVYNVATKSFWSFNGTAWEIAGGISDILPDNETTALSFSSESKENILSIDTTVGSEKVSIGNDLEILGNLNVLGTTTTINSTELLIEDPIFTLNKNGTELTAKAAGVGFEVEVDTEITGYIKTNEELNSWLFKSPLGHKITIKSDKESTLDINGPSVINQDVSTTSSPMFIGLNLSEQSSSVKLGEIDSAVSFDTETVTGILSINGTVDSEKVNIKGDLSSTGSLLLEGASIGSSGTDLVFTVGEESITLTEIKELGSIAKYDPLLGAIVFPDTIETIE